MCLCVRNALDCVAGQHEMELEQARQQAVDEYRAKALSETADLSDASVLTDLQAGSAVSLHIHRHHTHTDHTQRDNALS